MSIVQNQWNEISKLPVQPPALHGLLDLIGGGCCMAFSPAVRHKLGFERKKMGGFEEEGQEVEGEDR